MKRWILVLVFALVLNTNIGQIVFAETPEHVGTDYGIDEFFIGSGGEVDASSNSYSLRGSIGDLGIGNSASANYQAWGGFTTTAEPFLELAVNDATVNLGVLTATSTGTDTAEFQVRTYLASGYVVSIYGDTLTNENGDTIDAMAVAGSSTQGTKQFGINLVENTSPAAFGSDPQQVPDATFSFGAVATNYDTADQYRFVSGDTIATSASSTGQTTYTISYIANISRITGAGLFQAQHAIVATSTY